MKATRLFPLAVASALVLTACAGSSGDQTSDTRSRNAALTTSAGPAVLVRDIAATDQLALVQTGDDVVRVLGMNYNGLDSFKDAIAGKKITKLSVSYANAAVLDSAGNLYTGGYYPDYLKVTLPPGATKWVDVSLGANDIVAIADNGQVRTSSRADAFEMPTLANGGTKFVRVASGWFHHVLLDDKGNVYTTGRNVEGQRNIPALRGGAKKFVEVAANFYSTGLLDDKGNAYLFGWELSAAVVPTLTAGGTKFTSLALGTKHAALLDDKGNVYHAGDAFENTWKLPVGTKIVKVTAGTQYTLALDDRGVVHQASATWNTQRGVFTQTVPVIPVAASGNTTVAIGEDRKIVRIGEGFSADPPVATDIVSVGVGLNHGLGLTAKGTVTGWGSDLAGQVGQATKFSELAKVVGGPAWSAGLTRYGAVVGWGTGAPVGSGIDGVVRDIVAGHNHTTVLTTNGTVSSFGTLRDSAPSFMNFMFRRRGDGVFRSFRAIAANGECSVALGVPLAEANKGKPHFVGWGACSPEVLAAPDLSEAQSLAIGVSHGVAIKRDGSVVTWGDDTLGQRKVPAGLSNAVYVVAGDNHTVAVDAQGRVWAWGDNSVGQTDIPESLRLSSAELAAAIEARNNAGLPTQGAVDAATPTAEAAGNAAATDAEVLAAQLASLLPAGAPDGAADVVRLTVPVDTDLGGKIPASKTPVVKVSSSVTASRALALLKIKGAKKASYVVTKQPKSSPCSVSKSKLTAKKRGVCSAVVSYTDSKGKKAKATFAIFITS